MTEGAFIARAILDCNNVEEALCILQRQDRAAGFNHCLGFIGDQPQLACVETSAKDYFVTFIKDQPYGHANHLKEGDMDKIGQKVTESSLYRQHRIDELLLTATEVQTVLFDRESEVSAVYRANDNGDDYSQTLATVVFKLYASKVSVSLYGQAFQADPFYEEIIV